MQIKHYLSVHFKNPKKPFCRNFSVVCWWWSALYVSKNSLSYIRNVYQPLLVCIKYPINWGSSKNRVMNWFALFIKSCATIVRHVFATCIFFVEKVNLIFKLIHSKTRNPQNSHLNISFRNFAKLWRYKEREYEDFEKKTTSQDFFVSDPFRHSRRRRERSTTAERWISDTPKWMDVGVRPIAYKAINQYTEKPVCSFAMGSRKVFSLNRPCRSSGLQLIVFVCFIEYQRVAWLAERTNEWRETSLATQNSHPPQYPWKIDIL